MSSKAPGKASGNAEIRGIVARLVQKEKQVTQLQADLETLRGKLQPPQSESVSIHDIILLLS